MEFRPSVAHNSMFHGGVRFKACKQIQSSLIYYFSIELEVPVSDDMTPIVHIVHLHEISTILVVKYRLSLMRRKVYNLHLTKYCCSLTVNSCFYASVLVVCLYVNKWETQSTVTIYDRKMASIPIKSVTNHKLWYIDQKFSRACWWFDAANDTDCTWSRIRQWPKIEGAAPTISLGRFSYRSKVSNPFSSCTVKCAHLLGTAPARTRSKTCFH